MDGNLLLFIAFLFSTFIDVLLFVAIFFLFYKIYKTRIITTQNNGELHKLQDEVEEIKHHE